MKTPPSGYNSSLSSTSGRIETSRASKGIGESSMRTPQCQALTLPDGKVVGLLNEKDAAAYLAVAVQTLRNWRSLGKGPPFVYVGRRIGYRFADLERWVEKNTTQDWRSL